MHLVSRKMIGRGLLALTILSSCVLSLPLTSSQLENEDVKVMKCIVEALADVLSRPHPIPVNQECLVTLMTDDRLVSILHHHNFLKELQEIAVQGGQERAQLHIDAGTADPTTRTPQTAGDVADRSMLEALGGPGERSILSQKRTTGNGDREDEKDESLGSEESREDDDIAEEAQVKRGSEERPGSHSSESMDEAKPEKREEGEEGYKEKRANTEEHPEENMTKDKKGARSGVKKDALRNKAKERKTDEEEVEKDKRSALFSHEQEKKHEGEEDGEEDGEEMKRGSRENFKRSKSMPLKREAARKEAQQLDSQWEVPHHSKEVSEEEEEKKNRSKQRSKEEKELQKIARKRSKERRVSEEEGSASRKSEEPEIESLAAIESELENVAQKLHGLRRG